MLYAFDLDGTLIDSEELVRECYIAAGVTPPANFFGKIFKEWAPSHLSYSELSAIHNKKTQLYFDAIADGRLKALPMMDLYQKIKDPKTTHILTGASFEACNVLVSQFVLRPAARVHCSHTLQMKIDALNRESADGEGIVFEDNLEYVDEMRKFTKWTVCHVKRGWL